MSGGKRFTMLDLARDICKLLEEESKKFVTINTHQGLFQFIVYLSGYPQHPLSFNVAWKLCCMVARIVLFINYDCLS